MEIINEKTEEKPDSKITVKPVNDSRWLGGMVIVIAGVALLLRQIGIAMHWWLFTWPMLLVIVGLFSGAVRGFRSSGWVICLAIGGVFLIEEIFPGLGISHFIVPIIVITVGLMLIFGSRRRKWRRHNEWQDWADDVSNWKNHTGNKNMNREEWKKWSEELKENIKTKAANTAEAASQSTGRGEGYVDFVSVFGGNKKMVLSKTFRGGDIVNIFGGTELDLRESDIQGTVRLEITQVFGGTQLIVPRDWQVRSDMVTIFGGMDDKRTSDIALQSPDKILLIDGVSIFAGIEIQSW